MSISQADYTAALAQTYYANRPYVDSNFVLNADGSSSFLRHFTGNPAPLPDVTLSASADVVNQSINTDIALLQSGGLAAAGIDISTIFYLCLGEQRGLISDTDLASLSQALGSAPVFGQSTGSTYFTAAEVLANTPGSLARTSLSSVPQVAAAISDLGSIVGNFTVNVVEPTTLASVSSTNFTPGQLQDIAGLYVAYYNRAPDQSGLNFWVSQLQSSGSSNTLSQISASFAADNQFATQYGGLSNKDTVQAIYNNMLGGAGDAQGVAYWAAQLAAGTSLSDMVANLVYAGLHADLAGQLAAGTLSQSDYAAALVRQNTLINKAVVATQFVALFGAATTPASTSDLSSDPAYNASVAVLSYVTDSKQVAVDQVNDMARVLANAPDAATAVQLIGSHGTLAQSAVELSSWLS